MKTPCEMISSDSVTIEAAMPDSRAMMKPVSNASTPTMPRATTAATMGSSTTWERPKGAFGMESFLAASGVARIATK